MAGKTPRKPVVPPRSPTPPPQAAPAAARLTLSNPVPAAASGGPVAPSQDKKAATARLLADADDDGKALSLALSRPPAGSSTSPPGTPAGPPKTPRKPQQQQQPKVQSSQSQLPEVLRTPLRPQLDRKGQEAPSPGNDIVTAKKAKGAQGAAVATSYTQANPEKGRASSNAPPAVASLYNTPVPAAKPLSARQLTFGDEDSDDDTAATKKPPRNQPPTFDLPSKPSSAGQEALPRPIPFAPFLSVPAVSPVAKTPATSSASNNQDDTDTVDYQNENGTASASAAPKRSVELPSASKAVIDAFDSVDERAAAGDDDADADAVPENNDGENEDDDGPSSGSRMTLDPERVSGATQQTPVGPAAPKPQPRPPTEEELSAIFRDDTAGDWDNAPFIEEAKRRGKLEDDEEPGDGSNQLVRRAVKAASGKATAPSVPTETSNPPASPRETAEGVTDQQPQTLSFTDILNSPDIKEAVRQSEQVLADKAAAQSPQAVQQPVAVNRPGEPSPIRKSRPSVPQTPAVKPVPPPVAQPAVPMQSVLEPLAPVPRQSPVQTPGRPASEPMQGVSSEAERMASAGRPAAVASPTVPVEPNIAPMESAPIPLVAPAVVPAPQPRSPPPQAINPNNPMSAAGAAAARQPTAPMMVTPGNQMGSMAREMIESADSEASRRAAAASDASPMQGVSQPAPAPPPRVEVRPLVPPVQTPGRPVSDMAQAMAIEAELQAAAARQPSPRPEAPRPTAPTRREDPTPGGPEPVNIPPLAQPLPRQPPPAVAQPAAPMEEAPIPAGAQPVAPSERVPAFESASDREAKRAELLLKAQERTQLERERARNRDRAEAQAQKDAEEAMAALAALREEEAAKANAAAAPAPAAVPSLPSKRPRVDPPASAAPADPAPSSSSGSVPASGDEKKAAPSGAAPQSAVNNNMDGKHFDTPNPDDNKANSSGSGDEKKAPLGGSQGGSDGLSGSGPIGGGGDGKGPSNRPSGAGGPSGRGDGKGPSPLRPGGGGPPAPPPPPPGGNSQSGDSEDTPAGYKRKLKAILAIAQQAVNTAIGYVNSVKTPDLKLADVKEFTEEQNAILRAMKRLSDETKTKISTQVKPAIEGLNGVVVELFNLDLDADYSSLLGAARETVKEYKQSYGAQAQSAAAADARASERSDGLVALVRNVGPRNGGGPSGASDEKLTKVVTDGIERFAGQLSVLGLQMPSPPAVRPVVVNKDGLSDGEVKLVKLFETAEDGAVTMFNTTFRPAVAAFLAETKDLIKSTDAKEAKAKIVPSANKLQVAFDAAARAGRLVALRDRQEQKAFVGAIKAARIVPMSDEKSGAAYSEAKIRETQNLEWANMLSRGGEAVALLNTTLFYADTVVDALDKVREKLDEKERAALVRQLRVDNTPADVLDLVSKKKNADSEEEQTLNRIEALRVQIEAMLRTWGVTLSDPDTVWPFLYSGDAKAAASARRPRGAQPVLSPTTIFSQISANFTKWQQNFDRFKTTLALKFVDQKTRASVAEASLAASDVLIKRQRDAIARLSAMFSALKDAAQAKYKETLNPNVRTRQFAPPATTSTASGGKPAVASAADAKMSDDGDEEAEVPLENYERKTNELLKTIRLERMLALSDSDAKGLDDKALLLKLKTETESKLAQANFKNDEQKAVIDRMRDDIKRERAEHKKCKYLPATVEFLRSALDVLMAHDVSATLEERFADIDVAVAQSISAPREEWTDETNEFASILGDLAGRIKADWTYLNNGIVDSVLDRFDQSSDDKVTHSTTAGMLRDALLKLKAVTDKAADTAKKVATSRAKDHKMLFGVWDEAQKVVVAQLLEVQKDSRAIAESTLAKSMFADATRVAPSLIPRGVADFKSTPKSELFAALYAAQLPVVVQTPEDRKYMDFKAPPGDNDDIRAFRFTELQRRQEMERARAAFAAAFGNGAPAAVFEGSVLGGNAQFDGQFSSPRTRVFAVDALSRMLSYAKVSEALGDDFKGMGQLSTSSVAIRLGGIIDSVRLSKDDDVFTPPFSDGKIDVIATLQEQKSAAVDRASALQHDLRRASELSKQREEDLKVREQRFGGFQNVAKDFKVLYTELLSKNGDNSGVLQSIIPAFLVSDSSIPDRTAFAEWLKALPGAIGKYIGASERTRNAEAANAARLSAATISAKSKLDAKSAPGGGGGGGGQEPFASITSTLSSPSHRPATIFDVLQMFCTIAAGSIGMQPKSFFNNAYVVLIEKTDDQLRDEFESDVRSLVEKEEAERKAAGLTTTAFIPASFDRVQELRRSYELKYKLRSDFENEQYFLKIAANALVAPFFEAMKGAHSVIQGIPAVGKCDLLQLIASPALSEAFARCVAQRYRINKGRQPSVRPGSQVASDAIVSDANKAYVTNEMFFRKNIRKSSKPYWPYSDAVTGDTPRWLYDLWERADNTTVALTPSRRLPLFLIG